MMLLWVQFQGGGGGRKKSVASSAVSALMGDD